jgi:hypothetical protein
VNSRQRIIPLKLCTCSEVCCSAEVKAHNCDSTHASPRHLHAPATWPLEPAPGGSRDIAVGGDRAAGGTFRASSPGNVKTGSSVHLASCSAATEVLSPGCEVDHSPRFSAKFGMGGAVTQLPQYVFVVCTGTTLRLSRSLSKGLCGNRSGRFGEQKSCACPASNPDSSCPSHCADWAIRPLAFITNIAA